MVNQYPHMFELSGKIAVVTGAASGLGVVFSEAMAEAGADVVCADIDTKGLASTVEKVKKLGRKALAVACDVTKEEQVRNLAKHTEEAFGRLDILFNNAGVADATPTLLHEYPTEEWNRVLSIDLQGVFYCSREALKIMVRQKSGKIINIASIWGLSGSSSIMPVPAYNAAKGAVVNLTREMALQYASLGISVNAICPGFHITKLGPYDDAEFMNKITALIPMRRVAQADELKGAAIFLASSASNYITGTMLVADGGITAL